MNITVVGAGIIGLSCAYELTELGHQVTLIDADAAGAAASAGNAGWVTPFLSTPRAAPGAVRDAVQSFTSAEGPAGVRPHLEAGFASWIAKFLWSSSKKRSALTSASLQALSRRAVEHVDSLLDRGVAFEHHADGLAIVFKQAKHLEHYEALASTMRGAGDITVHRGSEVAAFDPAIRRGVAGVMHLEAERHVRPESLCAGLATAVVAGGGTLIEQDAVARIDRDGAAWAVETARGDRLRADRVVVAAGYATRALMKPLGVIVPLEAAKGTSMTAYGEGTAPTHPLKLYEDMVACSPFDGAVRLSGTFDLGRRDFDLDRKRLSMVVRQGLGYLEDWRPTNIEVEWVGHRPTSPDDIPIIGPVPGHDGLYLATGHGSLGMTLGPVTGALAAREITTGESHPLLEPFRLARFGASTRRPATR